ncbi:MAG: ABC transporter ATP-binding protein, partial [Bacteroidota bacterium]
LVDKQEVEVLRKDLNVISSQLKTGKTLVHVHSETQPDASFSPVDPDLEDVYFTRISERMDVVTV